MRPRPPGFTNMRLKGFREGSSVKSDIGELHKITKINPNGSVDLAAIDASGQVGQSTTIEHKAFIAKYELSTETIEIVPNWIQRRLNKTPAHIELLVKSSIHCALSFLVEEVESTKLRLIAKPRRGVFSEVKVVAQSRIVLVPDTSKVTLFEPPATAPPLSVAIGAPIDIGVKKVALLPSSATSAIAPFWWVRAVDSPDAANMTWASRSVSIAVQIGKKNTDKMVVEIPVLVNSSAVEINDELTVYRAPAVGKTKRGASTHLGATVKTPKVA